MRAKKTVDASVLADYARAIAEERQATRALSGAIDEMLRTGIRDDQLLEKLNTEMLDAHSKAHAIRERFGNSDNLLNLIPSPSIPDVQ